MYVRKISARAPHSQHHTSIPLHQLLYTTPPHFFSVQRGLQTASRPVVRRSSSKTASSTWSPHTSTSHPGPAPGAPGSRSRARCDLWCGRCASTRHEQDCKPQRHSEAPALWQVSHAGLRDTRRVGGASLIARSAARREADEEARSHRQHEGALVPAIVRHCRGGGRGSVCEK